MKRLTTENLIHFNQQNFQSKALVNEQGFRILLLTLKAGHVVPEHSSKERVTVVSLRGLVRFTEGDTQTELGRGDVLLLDAGNPHKLEALEDSALLVLATSAPVAEASAELDLRQVERPFRHPLVFKRLEDLALEQSVTIVNDHAPVPLLSQIASRKPGEMEWEYLERGPDFRIRIRRVAVAPAVPAESTV